MNPTEIIPVRAFQDTYIWVMQRGGHAAVVDPGDAKPVLDYLRAQNLSLTAILNTHHHADHVGGNAELLRHRDVPVYGPYDDRIATVPTRRREGDRFTLAEFGLEFSVLESPAHTRSHIAFVAPGILFSGDTLFACGCGRLFEGTPQQMHASLAKLAMLPDATEVYCGHEYTLSNIRFARAVETGNPELPRWEQWARTVLAQGKATLPSTIAREKAANPFMRCDQADVIAAASKYAGRPLGDPASVLGAIRDWKNNS
jgi:hydroxyacylglutathione hydrolase